MMYEEFIANGAKGEISEETYRKVEDVYCAYNRFGSKKAIADFWNDHGEEGISAMVKPLDSYRQLKERGAGFDEEIKALQKQIALLQEKKAALKKEMKEIELQCDLSWHWCR